MQNTRAEMGSRIRALREGAGFSLRALAKVACITPSYLSDIEHGRRSPSEKTLVAVCAALDLNIRDLLASVGRLDASTERYLTSHPTAGALLRRIAELDLLESELQALLSGVDQLRPAGRPGRAATRASSTNSDWSVEL
jgi:transcriptional regulator with XRE-family HTH domain